jgi:hypothetical protein
MSWWNPPVQQMHAYKNVFKNINLRGNYLHKAIIWQCTRWLQHINKWNGWEQYQKGYMGRIGKILLKGYYLHMK